MSDDIDALSAAAYEGGRDPIDWSVTSITAILTARQTMVTRAENGLPALAGWHDVSDEAVARKVIGSLLNAGWSPPSDEAVQAAKERSRRNSERFQAWLDSLTPAQRDRAMAHYEQTCEWPLDLRPPASER